MNERNQNKKPSCQLVGQDSNIFNLAGIASRTLKEHGLSEQADEMCQRIYRAGSFDEALGIIQEYVDAC